MSLDGAARSRPVLHDVAARQVNEVSVPVMVAPPAHRIDVETRRGAAVLRPATIVVAHLELRQLIRLCAAWPVFARRHEVIGDTHHETEAPSTGIGEYVGLHRPAVKGVHVVVDRYMPCNLPGGLWGNRLGYDAVPIDFDLAFGHDALLGRIVRILPEKDVEPEGDLPSHRGPLVGEELRLVYCVFIRCVIIAARRGVGGYGIDAPTASPLPRGALGRGRRDPEIRALRRHADVRLVGTRRGQQSGRNEARPDDQASVFSLHVRSALLAVDDYHEC